MSRYYFILLLLFISGISKAQPYTYTAGQNLGVFEGRALRDNESLYIPKGVTAYCTLQVIGENVKIVNDGTWYPSQFALEFGAYFINNGQVNATFIQVNNGIYNNMGGANFKDIIVGPEGRLNNAASGRIVITNTLQVSGQVQNCGQIEAANYVYYWNGILLPCQPLPIELVSFTATPIPTGVLLKWLVGSELNLSHYEVQRSNDGLTFSFVGKVAAKGLASYSLTDKPNAERVYYRLRSVDNDATEAYSAVVVVNGSELVGSEYYNEAGQRIPKPLQGFYIEVTMYRNGAIERRKYFAQ